MVPLLMRPSLREALEVFALVPVDDSKSGHLWMGAPVGNFLTQ